MVAAATFDTVGIGIRKPKFELKTPEQFAKMREAGLVVAQALEQVKIINGFPAGGTFGQQSHLGSEPLTWMR